MSIGDTFPNGEKKLRCSAIGGTTAWFYETPFTTTEWEEYYSFEPSYSCVGKGVDLPLEVGKAYSHETVAAACENLYASPFSVGLLTDCR